MKVSKFKSSQIVSWRLSNCAVDWDKKVSKPQKKIKDLLKPLWFYDRVLEEAYIPGSKKRLDLVNLSKMIVIEVSPDSVHQDFNPFFHGTRCGLARKMKADHDKEEWCINNGFDYISLDDEEIKLFTPEYILSKYNIRL